MFSAPSSFAVGLEVPLGVLLVSTFTFLGLAIVQAMQARGHWSLRVGIVLVVLSPLLAVPAVEPLIVLLLQALTIVVCRWIAPRCAAQFSRSPRPNAPVEPRWRFSISSLLAITTYAAIGAAVANHIPPFELQTWRSIVCMGCGAGLCVALGEFTVHGYWRWWIRVPLAVVLVAAIGWALASYDDFVLNITAEASWPNGFSLFTDPSNTWIWFATCASVTSLTAVWLSWRERPTSLALAARRVLFATVLVYPACALWHLLNPIPLPMHPPLTENAFPRIIEAGKRIVPSPFEKLHMSSNSVSNPPMAEWLDEFQDELTSLGPLLRQPSDVQPDYFDSVNERFGREAQASRTLARAFVSRGRLDLSRGDVDRASAMYVNAIRLGYSVRAQGLHIHALVGTACSDLGLSQLYDDRRRLSSAARRFAIRELCEIAAATEPFSELDQRERAWSQRAEGWSSRLIWMLVDHAQQGTLTQSRNIEQILLRELAVVRLLAVELAIESYIAEHGKPPPTLDALVPDFLPTMLVDPFSPREEPFRYRQSNETYLVYSLGGNRLDDGGQGRKSPSPNQYPFIVAAPLDLLLRMIYPERPSQATPNAQGAEPSEP